MRGYYPPECKHLKFYFAYSDNKVSKCCVKCHEVLKTYTIQQLVKLLNDIVVLSQET